MYPHLRKRWLRLVTELGDEDDPLFQDWFLELDALLARYAEPHRAYHTLVHIEHCLAELDEVRKIVPGDMRAIEFAIWYHDAIYDTTSKDNEFLSAELARTVLLKSGFQYGFADGVAVLIMDTAHEDRPDIDREDSKLLLDIDLAILGQPESRFDEYEREVRTEYHWVPEEAFRTGRSAILQKFLDRHVPAHVVDGR